MDEQEAEHRRSLVEQDIAILTRTGCNDDLDRMIAVCSRIPLDDLD